MEEEMEVLCVEGLATHGDPESCVDDPVRAWRSVDRGTCRPGYRAAKYESGVPTLSMRWKATLLAALSRAAGRPRRSAGINRHGGGDGRALHRRSSEPR